MFDLRATQEFLRSLGIDFHTEICEGYKHYEVPKNIQKQISFKIYTLGATLCFDHNGRYLGSIVGDDQFMWEEKS